jgi:hypothetical protein
MQTTGECLRKNFLGMLDVSCELDKVWLHFLLGHRKRQDRKFII